jgi:hypothetical protein
MCSLKKICVTKICAVLSTVRKVFDIFLLSVSDQG